MIGPDYTSTARMLNHGQSQPYRMYLHMHGMEKSSMYNI